MRFKSLCIKTASLALLQWIVSAVGRYYHVLVVFYVLIVFLFMLEETLHFRKRYEYCERELKGQYPHDIVLPKKVSSLINYLGKIF